MKTTEISENENKQQCFSNRRGQVNLPFPEQEEADVSHEMKVTGTPAKQCQPHLDVVAHTLSVTPAVGAVPVLRKQPGSFATTRLLEGEATLSSWRHNSRGSRLSSRGLASASAQCTESQATSTRDPDSNAHACGRLPCH